MGATTVAGAGAANPKAAGRGAKLRAAAGNKVPKAAPAVLRANRAVQEERLVAWAPVVPRVSRARAVPVVWKAGMGGMVSAAGCAHATCQSFETDLSSAWSLSASAGTVKVVKDQVTAMRGPGSALQIHLLKTTSEAMAKGYVTLKTVPESVKTGAGDLFARFFTYFSAPHDFRHSFMFRGNGAVNESNVEFGGQTGNKWILAPLGKVFDPVGSIPVKKWICVEAQFKKSTGELKLLVDGQQVASATNTQGEALTTYRFIQFGMVLYHDLPADFDMYLDDLAVDVKAIGCTP